MKEKSSPSHKLQSIIWFSLSLVMVAVGIIIIIPILGIYGICWTITAVLMASYHGYNIFSKKRIFIWEPLQTDEDKADS
ncbi:MAG: hypothetical protein JXQ23_13040 [Clostridia bacterium]|nr:hypothetical protein [Clostridia bacterium]